MIKITKFWIINPSYQQYWDNVNRFLWAANYFGLDPNALAQLSQRPIESLGKQTISSTNTENNGLGAFIGSYRENSTNSKPDIPKPDEPKPEVVNPKPEIPAAPPTKPIPVPSLPEPKPPVNDPPSPTSPPTQPPKPEPPTLVDNKEPSPPNFKPPNMGIYYQNSPVFYHHPQHIPQFHPLIFNQPLVPFPFPLPAQFSPFAPQPQPPPPAPGPFPVPVPKPPANGPFSIQQPTITQNGETIVENLIGGLTYNCHGRPTGHYRDTKFCDVFHACVFGQQRKTYACPFVGEPQYFDDVTRRCEFVRNNPLGCASNAFYN